MLSTRKALTGRRVYRGTGQAPNRGQVSSKGAQGYIRRELRNKNQLRRGRQNGFSIPNPKGRDGLSDNRSGVAAQALNRFGGQRFGGPRLGRRIATGSGGRKNPFKNEGRPIVKNQGKGSRGNPITDQVGHGPRGQGQQNPQVRVNEAGLLELPYNQDYNAELYGALDEANSGLLGLKAEGDQQQLEYTNAKRDAELNYGQLRRQTLNENAAGGTAFSSRYGNAVASNATNFANEMAGLEGQNAAFGQNQALQRAAIQSALNQQLALATQNYGVALGEQAGTLGYGKSRLRAKHAKRPNSGSKNRSGGKKGNAGKSRASSKKSSGSSNRTNDRSRAAALYLKRNRKK